MAALTNAQRRDLIQQALQARQAAYAPYSHYPVGAALLCVDGRIFQGANVENAAYPNGICAERVAVFTAVTAGRRQFDAVVVATANGGTPCGACRQVLAEFGLDLTVILVDEIGRVVSENSLADLLPGAFLPKDLDK